MKEKHEPYQVYVEYPAKLYMADYNVASPKHPDRILENKAGKHCCGAGTDFSVRDIEWRFDTEKEARSVYRKLSKVSWLKKVKLSEETRVMLTLSR